MTDLKQAAKAVVERWDTPAWEWRDQGPTADLMADLRKALAQPEQEPVAWRVWSPDGTNVYQYTEDGDGEPLYTTPPQRKPLTEEEISNIWDDTVMATVIPFSTGFARAIEAAHNINEGT
jgi:hypothetical protein